MPTTKKHKILLVRLFFWGLTAYSAARCYSLFEAGNAGAGLIHAGFTSICFLASLNDFGWLWKRRNTSLTELIEQQQPGDSISYRIAGFLSFVLIIIGTFIQSQ
jgi:hypothetical protein